MYLLIFNLFYFSFILINTNNVYDFQVTSATLDVEWFGEKCIYSIFI